MVCCRSTPKQAVAFTDSKRNYACLGCARNFVAFGTGVVISPSLEFNPMAAHAGLSVMCLASELNAELPCVFAGT